MIGAAASMEVGAFDQQIIDSAIDFAIVATDVRGRIIRWNSGAEHILGWTEAEMLGEPVDRFFTPEDCEARRPETEMQSALSTGRGNDERWHLRKTGERFWAQGEMMVLRHDDGSAIGFVKMLRDRTAERMRQDRLSLLSRASYGLLASDDPDAVIAPVLKAGAQSLGFDQSFSYVLTKDGAHLRLTHAMGVDAAIGEDAEDEAFDGPLCGIVAQSREPLILSAIQTSTETRYRGARDAGLRAFAGFPVMGMHTLYGVLSFASISRDSFDDEALSFFSTLARFLSVGRERSEREAAVSDLNLSLEARVNARTKDLLSAEDALRQSQKMDAVGQLTGGVAHDFNNLLTVIRGSVDLLRRDNLSPEKRTRYIDAIGDTADRAAKLTGQLLAFARRQSLKPEVFDVGCRIAGIMDMLNTVTGTRIRIETQLPDIRCLVNADASQFETALVNMAVNARDAMQGEGTLTVALRCSTSMPAIRGHAGSNGAFVAVSLIDTGTGIAKEDIARIFEPFFTTKDVGKGTGLGLSQVFGFAKQSNGDIDVESEVGRGTMFTLYLPEADADAQIAQSEGGEGEVSDEGTGLCVLVVEDNVDVGRFSTQVLQDFGYKTVWVATAEDAIDKLGVDGNGFDVVFSDVVMPGMGGIELAKRLQTEMPRMPVVLASGYSHVLAQEGAHGFELLQKPYSADQLSTVLRQVTNKRPRHGHPPAT